MPFTVALQRSDRTEALFRGDVTVDGFEIDLIDMSVTEIFNRMLRDQAFDASEMSFAYGLIAHGRGTPPLVTLPVYPHRTFRQSSLFVRADGAVRSPADLRGKTFAIHDFFAADPLWVRGMLREQFDVDPRDIRWLQYAFRDRIPLPKLDGYQLDYAIGADPGELLLSGQADVAFAPEWPAPFRAGSPLIKPLFDDTLAEEMRYFNDTGIHPLLHGFVLRGDVHEAQPGLAAALYRALVASRDNWYEALYSSPSALSGLPLFTSLTLHVKQTMGHDFWPYGLAANRAALQKGISYAVADGLLDAPFDPADLFPAEFRST
jgi:4,5-dihydroxyphthalate decarboxylase